MLIFDFDGVLMDSLDEIVVTAYNAVQGTLFTSLDDLPPEVVVLFKQNRYHFQPIGDALPLMSWCLENYSKTPNKYLSPEEFRILGKNASKPLAYRTDYFFATRRSLIDADKRRWLALNKPYQPLWDALIKYGAEKIVILTNKNRQATALLCRNFNLEIWNENIYSGDGGTTKIENLSEIQKRFKQTSYRFIDDLLSNLQELEAHFNKNGPIINLLYASWGYGGPGEADAAKSAGFSVLKQTDIIRML
jgi:phosphoglycolate phosphatase-like HAD superfamily hydrolase